MKRSLVALPLAALLLSACGSDAPEVAAPLDEGEVDVSATLRDAAGADRGTVTFSFEGTRTVVSVDAAGLPPGLHGLHVHAVGACEPDSADPSDPTKTGDFLSAGGHLKVSGQVHGDHDGDLPSLLVGSDGEAELTTTSSRLDRAKVLDGDGAAVMVHALSDNAANIPERYDPDPDDTTLATGDAGARLACAVIED